MDVQNIGFNAMAEPPVKSAGMIVYPVIHPDGTVTHYISGDLKPEERAKIEAKIKAEKEEKAKRRQEYLELSQEASTYENTVITFNDNIAKNS